MANLVLDCDDMGAWLIKAKMDGRRVARLETFTGGLEPNDSVSSKQQKARAQLWIAAEDLLAACENLVAVAETYVAVSPDHGDTDEERESDRRHIAAAKAAIAKARKNENDEAE